MGLILFLFGLIVGSFLNCVIYRLEVGEGFLRGRSYCPRCKHKLGPWDLIPVLSFIWLKGRCRYCREKINIQYPLVEITTALLFILIAGYQLPLANYFLTSFLVVIFVYDLKHYIIPDKVVYPAILASGIFLSFYTKYEILNAIYSAFGAAGFFSAIVLISRGRWMGIGDIKLAFLMGLILGFPDILAAMFLAFLIGAIIGIGLIILGKKNMKSEVPFGPFLVGGTFIALFWGRQLIDWYFNLCAGGLL